MCACQDLWKLAEMKNKKWSYRKIVTFGTQTQGFQVGTLPVKSHDLWMTHTTLASYSIV